MTEAMRKLNKLRSMGRSEFFDRTRQKARLELERAGLVSCRPEFPDGNDFKNYLAGDPARRFYPGIHPHLTEFFCTNSVRWG